MIKTSSLLERLQFKVIWVLLTFQKHSSHLGKKPKYLWTQAHTYIVCIQNPLLFYPWRERTASSKASFANTCKTARVPRWQLGIISTPGLFPLQTLASVDGSDAFIFPQLSLQIKKKKTHQDQCQEAQTLLYLHISSFSMRTHSANIIKQSNYDSNLPIAFFANIGNHIKVPKADANYLQHMQKYQGPQSRPVIASFLSHGFRHKLWQDCQVPRLHSSIIIPGLFPKNAVYDTNERRNC